MKYGNIFKIGLLTFAPCFLFLVCCSGGSGNENGNNGSGNRPTEAEPSTTPEAIGMVAAFPGAEGGGMFTTGGRGGKTLTVTSLDDDGSEGTLRWAVNQNFPRTIVFNVAGIIQLKSPLKIRNGNLTIAGQSAPGDGICLRDYSVTIEADNVIVRFMRFRLGDASIGDASPQEDCIGARYRKHLILDHCSMSWSIDECGSFYANDYFTLQWSVLSESLRNSGHPKGAHGYGGIWGGYNASFHHNLFAHHDNRNPRFDHPQIYGTHPNRGHVDHRNNVVYNWGNNNAYGGEGGSFNIVNNYYKEGPASRQRGWFVQTYGVYTSTAERTDYGHPELYIAGNIYTPDRNGITANNRLGAVSVADGSATPIEFLNVPLTVKSGENDTWVTTHSASDAFERVLDYGGASFARDAVDSRAVADARSGGATFTDGGNGSTNGLIDTQEAVGGWPVYAGTPHTDTDGDGIPDAWERANGLDPSRAGDSYARTLDPDGKYTNLEMYLNSLVGSITEAQNNGGIRTGL